MRLTKGTSLIAVIDVGSNSVRLVVYDGLKRVPMPVFNEKILCGLAYGMREGGSLNEESVLRAASAIRRFVSLARLMKVKNINLLATSAVRDARDGQDFVEMIRKQNNVKVQILSGEQEAELAALGILSAVPKADGLVGDLGGGSIEFASVRDSLIEDPVSFPLGSLRLMHASGGDKSKAEEIINAYLQGYNLQGHLEGKSFYAVGGAFRNLAKVHMERKNYPLKVLHNYKIKCEDFCDTLDIVSRMSEVSLRKIKGISSKRLSFLPVASLLAKSIVERGNPAYVVFSTNGIREGFLYSKLPVSQKDDDPTVSGAYDLAAHSFGNSAYARELFDWMDDIFDVDDVAQRLRLIACILSEISCFENTEYRAQLAYEKIMDSSLKGLEHKERALVATAVYFRYKNTLDEDILSISSMLLSSDDFYLAKKIGASMRLARSVCASYEGILPLTDIRIEKDKLILELKDKTVSLEGESVLKRLKHLASVMKLKPKVI